MSGCTAVLVARRLDGESLTWCVCVCAFVCACTCFIYESIIWDDQWIDSLQSLCSCMSGSSSHAHAFGQTASKGKEMGRQ